MTTATADLRETGFDPLTSADALFRRVLDATAHPGRPIAFGDVGLCVPPAPLRPACALLLAVLDREVSFAVVGQDARWIREYLRFNTRAAIVPVDAADFVLVADGTTRAEVDRGRRGMLDAPHHRATVVFGPSAVATSSLGDGIRVVITGPGVVGESILHIRGIAAEDFEWLGARGGAPVADVWLAGANAQLAVLPRSVRWRCEPA